MYDIDLAMQKYATYVDDEITRNSDKLNDIMTFFTVLSISCVPGAILTGLFGMNV